MGVYFQPGPVSGANAPLVALHPHLNESWVLGAYLDNSGDNIQFRPQGFADPMFWIAATAGLTRWVEHPFSTTRVTALNRSELLPLELRVNNIANGSYVGIIYAYESDSLISFKEYQPMRIQTYFSSVSGDDLSSRLGDDAYLAGITIGNGTGDAVQLRVPTLNVFDSDVTIGGGTRSYFFPFPLPTNWVTFVSNAYGDAALTADVTVGASGEVSLLYYKL